VSRFGCCWQQWLTHQKHCYLHDFHLKAGIIAHVERQGLLLPADQLAH